MVFEFQQLNNSTTQQLKECQQFNKRSPTEL